MENSIIIAVAETISELKRDVDFYRTLYETVQKEKAQLHEKIAALMAKFETEEAESNAENTLEAAR